jgi:hypothetical protein
VPVPDADEVPTLQRIAGLVNAMEALEGAGLRLLFIHPDEVVVRRKFERRPSWWRRERRK